MLRSEFHASLPSVWRCERSLALLANLITNLLYALAALRLALELFVRLLRYRWFRIALSVVVGWRWDWLWHYFRFETWDSPIGAYLNAPPSGRWWPLGALQDEGPIRRDIYVRDRLENGEYVTEKFWVDLIEFSETQLRERLKFLTAPSSDEDSRRGRSRRGRDTFQGQRLRQYNFERSVYDWNLLYPRMKWNKELGEYERHPHAQEPIKINRREVSSEVRREVFGGLSGHTAEQINSEIDMLNEPPEELPEVRDDESGEVIDEAVETPTAVS